MKKGHTPSVVYSREHIPATLAFVLTCLLLLPKSHAKESILVGLDADMSSVAAEGGNAIYRGAKIAVDEINAAGGVLNKPIELMVKDHRGNPARGARNLQAFKQESQLVAVLGGVHTPVILNELNVIHDNQMLFLVPWAAGTPIIDNGFEPNFVFRSSVRDSEAATVLLGDAQARGFKRIALVLERTGWGRSNQVSMSQVAEQLGIEIVDIEWINWRQTSFSDQMKQIAESGAEAVVLVSNAPEGAVALGALLDNEFTQSLPVISHWGIGGGKFVEQIGLDRLKYLDLSVLQTFHFSLTNIDRDKSKRVLDAYKKQFDPQATEASVAGQVGLAHAYDLVHMLALAMASANSTEPSSIRQALINLTDYQGLVKYYQSPFAEHQDALWAPDYILTRYDDNGFLVPRNTTDE